MDLLAYGQAPVHAALFALLVLVTGLATWRGLERGHLALLAAILVAGLAPAHRAPSIALGVALAPALLALVAPAARWLATPIAAAIAGGAAYAITQAAQPAAIAAGLAGVATLARPIRPTGRQVAYLRTAALYAPALVLAGLMAGNAATGYADTLEVRQILELVLALSGASALAAIAGLGVATLLETTDVLQHRAWTALATGLAVPVGVARLLDPSLAIEALAVASVPLALAAAVATARLARRGPGPVWVAYAAPIAAVGAQLGI